MKKMAVAVSILAACIVQAEEVYDVVVYGSTPAALTAAIEAGRHGKSAVIVCPETRIGGLTTGGLGQTDIGNKAAFGGLALQFYKDVATYYGNPDHLVVQFPDEKKRKATSVGILKNESKWTFEPSVALSILEGWEKKHGLVIQRGEWLDRGNGGVEKKDGRIVSFKTLSGKVYRGKVFVDATYEGDLMAAAGVSYHVGREANSVYGETLNGNEPGRAKFHQLHKGIDPYVVPGDPKSGLLPCVEQYDPNFKPGDGDKRVQAYCFRMCLTDYPANRIPFKKPEGYDEKDYELMFRHFALGPLDHHGMPWINSRMPNRKTDTNNRTGFSTDFIGQNWNWPEASYEEREKILAAHLKYQRGLMWTLANHPRVPGKIRNEVSRWGTCKDEFKDGLGDGWQKQLYVREARRMVGEYVMTEANCRGKITAPRPVAMGAYTMDSHHVRRYVTADGYVQNEGDVEVGTDGKGRRFPPYPIDYGAIVPKRAECSNLLVPVCLSASHIAFGSIRMEPVFFALGQAAGTAASLAVADDVAVQDVPYDKLRSDLEAAGQVLSVKTTTPPQVRVMTYNVRYSAGDRKSKDNNWKARRDDFARTVERESPDVIGFQEVLPDQRKWLEKRFPDYEFTGEGRNADRVNGEASPVAFRRDRFEIVRKGTFWLSETPDVPGSKSWNTAIQRICTYAVLKDKATGKTFSFANTHTDHRSEEAREKGMLLIIKRMKDFGKGAPVVFVGDHNCLEWEAPAKAVSKILTDAIYLSKTPPQGSWRTFNFWNWHEKELSIVEALKKPIDQRSIAGDKSDMKRIDYIYVSPGTTVLDYRTVCAPRPGTKLYPSDHFPSVATLVFK